MKKIRVGGGQGFWGDSNDAAIHMVKTGSVDYLCCDYLAELTLSIMQRQRLKNPRSGYATDFVRLFESIVVMAYEKNIKIVTNAGGSNVAELVSELARIVHDKGLTNYKIGYVEGDDVLSQIPHLIDLGVPFTNLDEVGDFSQIRNRLVNANVYFGRKPIQACLQEGANVVITGRASDSALFLAPIQLELGFGDDDLDHLAQGIVAGHLLECGGQGAGGNFDYDWRSVPDMAHLGYPIAEVSLDHLIITKAPDCGGLISVESVKEQLIYEIHDPSNYITPDVVVDFTQVTLKTLGDNRVEVIGVKGKPETPYYKCSAGYQAGYRATGLLSFAWPDAYEKAQKAAEIIHTKLTEKKLEAISESADYIGANALHLSVAKMDPDFIRQLNEVVLRYSVYTLKKEEASKLSDEIAPLQLNGPPGASFFGGKPKVTEVVALWPTLIPKQFIEFKHHIIEVGK